MEIEVFNKKYEVLEIIPKKHEEHDLFVCKAPAGYRECFQRFDIGREARKTVQLEQVPWNYDEIIIIKNKLKQGMTPTQISKCEELKRHTETAIYSKALRVRMDMNLKNAREKESKPRFNIKF